MIGKDRGKIGKVIRVYSDKNKILLEGLNLYKKHVRPKRQGEKGEVVLVPRPLNASNTMIICYSCKKAVRAGHREENGVKLRYCKKCGSKL